MGLQKYRPWVLLWPLTLQISEFYLHIAHRYYCNQSTISQETLGTWEPTLSAVKTSEAIVLGTLSHSVLWSCRGLVAQSTLFYWHGFSDHFWGSQLSALFLTKLVNLLEFCFFSTVGSLWPSLLISQNSIKLNQVTWPSCFQGVRL